MTRRTATAALAGAAFARDGALGAQTPTHVRVASTTDYDAISAVYGRESGGFARAGLEVEIQRASSGAAVAAAVVGNAVDIGKSSVMGLVNARSRGIPFVIVAPAAVYSSETRDPGLIVAKDAPIHGGADLNGKTLSVSALNDLFSIAMQAWVDQHGGDARTLKFLELPNAAAGEAVATGRVDAATVANPQLAAALASGRVREIGRSFDAISPRFISAAFFCTAEYLARNRDAVARFRRVIVAAETYIDTHPAETEELVARYTGIERRILATMPRTRLGGPLDPRLLQPLIDRAVEYKAIPARIEAREMIDPAAQ